MAGWISQSLSTAPAMSASVEVDGLWYFNSRLVMGTFGANGSRELIRANADGSFTMIPFPANGSQGEPAWKSMIAVGTKIYIGIFSANSNVEVRVYDTVAGTWALVTIAAGGSSPGWGKPALGPDGLIYFPPYGGPSTMRPLVFNPATNTMAFTDFGSTWPVVSGGEKTGHFCMGGDGIMYFLPGGLSAWTSGYASGTKMGYISGWPTPTVTLFPTLPPDNGGGSSQANTWIWAAPAPDGIYAGTFGNNFYKITAAGPQFLRVANPFFSPPYNSPFDSELTNSATFSSNAIVAPDGLIYVVGYGYISSGNYPPVVATINPANDEVHFLEYLDFSGHPFVGQASYIHDGALRTWPVKVGSGATALIVDIFENELIVAPEFSYAFGSQPVTLALGANPVTARIG